MKNFFITMLIMGGLILLIGLQTVKIQEASITPPVPILLTYVSNSITPQADFSLCDWGDLKNIELEGNILRMQLITIL